MLEIVLEQDPVMLWFFLWLPCVAGVQQESVPSLLAHRASISRKEKDFQGMLEYKRGDESRLLKNLVVGMFTCLKHINQWSKFGNCPNVF